MKSLKVNSQPFFSVVVPVYNKAPYVARAINSILNQTFQDFELIIVCDPSIDNSNEEVAKFVDSRIRIFHRDKPGPGGYAARNLGVKQSKAEWITFLDADDIWYPAHLENSFNAVNQNKEIDFGFFNSSIAYGNDNFKKRRFNIEEQILSSIELLKIYAKNDIIHTNSIFVKKRILIKSGLFPDGKAKRGGDSDLWLRIILCSSNCFVSNTVTSVYYFENSGVVKNSNTAGSLHPVTLTVKSKIKDAKYSNSCKDTMVRLSNRKSLRLYILTKRFGSFKYRDLRNIFYSKLNLTEWFKVLILLTPYYVAIKTIKLLFKKFSGVVRFP